MSVLLRTLLHAHDAGRKDGVSPGRHVPVLPLPLAGGGAGRGSGGKLRRLWPAPLPAPCGADLPLSGGGKGLVMPLSEEVLEAVA